MNNFLLCSGLIPEYFGWITLSGIPSTLFYSYVPAIILCTGPLSLHTILVS